MGDSSRLLPYEPVIVADRLRVVREALDLSKAEFADMIGMDRSSYVKIEKGDKPLLPYTAYRIYELFGVDMNFLYLGQVGGLPSSLSRRVTTALTGRTS